MGHYCWDTQNIILGIRIQIKSHQELDSGGGRYLEPASQHAAVCGVTDQACKWRFKIHLKLNFLATFIHQRYKTELKYQLYLHFCWKIKTQLLSILYCFLNIDETYWTHVMLTASTEKKLKAGWRMIKERLTDVNQGTRVTG